jgi:hypothetical protein
VRQVQMRAGAALLVALVAMLPSLSAAPLVSGEPWGAWRTDNIHPEGLVAASTGPGLALDSLGRPHIAHGAGEGGQWGKRLTYSLR